MHFLEDARRSNGTGFCQLGIECCFLENDNFREFLRLESDSASAKRSERKEQRSAGIMVRRIEPTSGAQGILRSMDVILAVDDIPIGIDGKSK